MATIGADFPQSRQARKAKLEKQKLAPSMEVPEHSHRIGALPVTINEDNSQ